MLSISLLLPVAAAAMAFIIMMSASITDMRLAAVVALAAIEQQQVLL
jgi:hypothetical protein